MLDSQSGPRGHWLVRTPVRIGIANSSLHGHETVYASSAAPAPGAIRRIVAAAAELGTLLAERRIGFVYGGASIGLMGAVADAAQAAGGEVIGVIPVPWSSGRWRMPALADLRVVASMHERKALMAELSDGFIALPGGIGTLEELFEVWTWAQLGSHRKPCALLNVLGFL